MCAESDKYMCVCTMKFVIINYLNRIMTDTKHYGMKDDATKRRIDNSTMSSVKHLSGNNLRRDTHFKSWWSWFSDEHSVFAVLLGLRLERSNVDQTRRQRRDPHGKPTSPEFAQWPLKSRKFKLFSLWVWLTKWNAHFVVNLLYALISNLVNAASTRVDRLERWLITK